MLTVQCDWLGGLWCLPPLQQYFSYIMAVNFIGIRRKPPNCRKSLTNFIT